MKKKTIYLLGIMYVLCTFHFSCSKDNDLDNPSNPSVSSEELPFLGGWDISNLPSSGGHSGFMLFLENNKVIIYNNVGTWNYNKDTHVLATTLSYTWEINLIADDSWSAYYHRNGQIYDAYAYKNIKWALATILEGAKWMNGNDDCPLEGTFIQGQPYFYFNWASRPSDVYLKESPSKNYIEISRSSTFENKYILYNPYNYDKAYLETPDGIKYYPKNIKFFK